MKIDVLIIGAGIAGLSLAVGLEQLRLSYVIIEKRAEPDAPGAGILVHPSGLAALSSLGVDLMTSADFHVINEMHIGSPRRTSIVRQAVGDDRYPVIGLHRVELHRVLSTSLTKSAIKYGCRIAAVTQGRNERLVELDDGTVFETKLIVAADGANSSQRTDFDHLHRINTSSQVVWRWIVNRLLVPATGHEVHDGRWRLGVFPINRHQSYIFLAANGLRLVGAKELRIADLQARTRAMGDLGSELASLPMITSPLLHAVFDAPLRWQNDAGITLIGDAAHPITPDLGIGGSLALEDSAVLTAAIADGGCTTAIAKAALSNRSRRIRSLSRQSRLYGYSAHFTGSRATDLKLHALSLVPDRVARSFQKKLYADFYRSLRIN